ncbi:hypothetical protein AMTRI_Chr13g89490 [Amborella trichopoda]|uniref:non-specific serine/threonine protein kinase n=1 Tax=Amborella trichopoda TaxID=13333 RepID=U5DCD1_AMBTC|nr:L-type lectin-domain containing receptor kinase IX.1 [Amborella trichopoda]ERN18048.1 hypothetical protein AMTR_s00046p00197110 [Amborella trichopoda]|eukprot:XP_006856581.1 L-type lectin-domain containing receptor kinase IX.1 [Amborella trichopoda]
MALCNSSPPLFLFLHLFLLLHLSSLTHSVNFNFSSFNQSTPDIRYVGDAFSNGNGLQVTRNERGDNLTNSVGRAFYEFPIRLWDSNTGAVADFTSHFQFVINAFNESLYGDGLAFILAANLDIPSDSRGGNLGLYDTAVRTNSSSNPVVAVEFDSLKNDWDPNDNHVGINVNSIESVANVSWNSSIRDGRRANAWVTYNGTTKRLSVFLTYVNNPTFRGNSSLSHEVDLSKVLPECVNIGFSAATGNLVEVHTVFSWEFSSSLGSCDEGKVAGDKRWVIWFVLCLVFFMVGMLVLIMVVWRRRVKKKLRERGDMEEDEESMDEDFERGNGPRRFKYKELVSATNGFNEEGKLGEGGFGGVYMGLLTDTNEAVAVKRVSSGSKQGKKEFVSEVTIISRLRHRNLVQLIGWCHYRAELLLVYEFMPNGSLDQYLFGKKTELTWDLRYKVAMGLASSMLYLHEEWEQCVVHRDIKSSNIMLDTNFNAKLGDFGLARLVDHDQPSQTTVIAGTMGYLAPECVTTGKASRESDVYSFGVVALEICCGRRAIEPLAKASRVRLVEWVWECYGEGRLLDCVDEKLFSDFDKRQIECLMVVGLWCAHPDPTPRPSIRQVIQVLNFDVAMPLLPSKMPVPMYFAPPMNLLTFSYTTSSNITDSHIDSTTTTTTSRSTMSSSTSPKYLLELR